MGDYKPDNRASMMAATGPTFNQLGNGDEIIAKGSLVKKNWYGNKQVRFFELHNNGELKYYADKRDFKGSIQLGPSSKVRKTAKTTITLTCEKKKKEYVLIQPDTT